MTLRSTCYIPLCPLFRSDGIRPPLYTHPSGLPAWCSAPGPSSAAAAVVASSAEQGSARKKKIVMGRQPGCLWLAMAQCHRASLTCCCCMFRFPGPPPPPPPPWAPIGLIWLFMTRRAARNDGFRTRVDRTRSSSSQRHSTAQHSTGWGGAGGGCFYLFSSSSPLLCSSCGW